MVQVFFDGHGYWFFEHKRSRRTYSISRFATNKFLLFPIHDEEIVCRDSFQTIGFFNLDGEDELAYRELESESMLKNRVTKLWPCLTYHSNCTFTQMHEQLEIGAARIKAEDCYFIIDREKPFEIKAKTSNTLINTELAAKAETRLNIPSKADIKKRYGKQRHNVTLELLHAALDYIEQNTGKTPGPEELVSYVLGGEFKHQNIQKQGSGSVPVRRRELQLMGGETLNAAKIKRRYKETIFPNKPDKPG